MIAQEGRPHALRNGLLQFADGLHIGCGGLAGAQRRGDVPLRLGHGEQEEAVHAARIVFRNRVQPRPDLAHQIAAGLELLGGLLQPGEEGDVLRRVRGEVAGHRVQAEAVHPHLLQPKGHDGADFLLHSGAGQVQVGHASAGKLLLIIPVRAGHGHHLGAVLMAEAVVIHIGAAFVPLPQGVAGGGEPGVPGGGMIDGQVDDDAHVPPVAGLHQGAHVLQGAVLRIDGPVIRHIVLVIAGAWHHGHEPQSVVAQAADVVQPGEQPGQVAHAVAVGILIGIHENLVPVEMHIRFLGQGHAGRKAAQGHEQAKQPFHERILL